MVGSSEYTSNSRLVLPSSKDPTTAVSSYCHAQSQIVTTRKVGGKKEKRTKKKVYELISRSWVKETKITYKNRSFHHYVSPGFQMGEKKGILCFSLIFVTTYKKLPDEKDKDNTWNKTHNCHLASRWVERLQEIIKHMLWKLEYCSIPQ